MKLKVNAKALKLPLADGYEIEIRCRSLAEGYRFRRILVAPSETISCIALDANGNILGRYVYRNGDLVVEPLP